MERYFASGRAVDVILAVLALEAAALLAWRGRSALPDLIGIAAPGVLLLLALRAALTGRPWQEIALWTALSFPVHLYDLRRRGLLAPKR